MCSLFSHCRGSDPPQKHAGAASPSPAVEKNNSSFFQTTSDADTEQASSTAADALTQTQVVLHKHALVHTHKMPEGRKEVLLCTCFCFITVDLSQRLKSTAECFMLPMVEHSIETFRYHFFLPDTDGRLLFCNGEENLISGTTVVIQVKQVDFFPG